MARTVSTASLTSTPKKTSRTIATASGCAIELPGVKENATRAKENATRTKENAICVKENATRAKETAYVPVTGAPVVPQTAPAATPPIVVRGLRDHVRIAKLMKSLKTRQDGIAEALKPSLLAAHMRNAEGVLTVADLKKTIEATDFGTTANLQIRGASKALKIEDIQLLTKASIPLKLEPSRCILNPKYAGGASTEVERAEAQRVIVLLTQLVAANPHLNIPADLFSKTEPVTKPDDDALLLALQSKLPTQEALAVLDLLASVVVLNGKIDRSVPVPRQVPAVTETIPLVDNQPTAEIIQLATHTKDSKQPSKAHKEKSASTHTAVKKQSSTTKAFFAGQSKRASR